MSTSTERRALRREMRRRRRALGASDRREAARALSKRLAGSRWFANSRTIAVYLPNDGEISLLPLVARAWSMGQAHVPPEAVRAEAVVPPLSRADRARRQPVRDPRTGGARPPAHPPDVPGSGAVPARRVRPVREPARDGWRVLRPNVRGGTPPRRMAGTEAGRGRLRDPAGWIHSPRRTGTSPSTPSSPNARPGGHAAPRIP